MVFRIISCDGGGIRELLMAKMLEDLVKKFSVIEKAEGFAGTSTRGLLAFCLAKGISIAKIIDF